MSRIVLGPFVDLNPFKTDFFSSETFSTDVQQGTFAALQAALLGINVASFSNLPKSKNGKQAPILKHQIIRRTFFLSMLVTSICATLALLKIARETIEHGYLYLYTGDLLSTHNNPGLRFINIVEIVYFLYVGCIPTRRKFLYASLLYLIPQSIFLLIGLRGQFVLAALVVYWLSVSVYRVRLNKIFAAVSVLVGIIILQLVAMLRMQAEISLNLASWWQFFWNQGISMHVVAYSNALLDQLRSDLYENALLYPLKEYAGSLGLITSIQKSQIFPFYLAEHLNPYLFAQGFGLGSSAVAELYIVGGSSLVFLGTLLALFIGGHITNSIWHRTSILTITLRPLTLVFLKKLFWSPRGAALDWVPSLVHTSRNLILILIFLTILTVLISLIKRLRSEASHS